MLPGETQATFTGAQQRGGVALLAFVVIGLFGRLEPHVQNAPAASEAGCAAAAGGGAAAVGGAAAAATARGAASAGAAAQVGGDEAKRLHKGFQFDWAAYHAAFGDTPLDVAVTEMFAEYASLYARLSSRVGDSVPPPMTLPEAVSISEQAKKIVFKYVIPLLGHSFSIKLHKMLRHLLDAIRYHGNLRNGDTSSNEEEHKVDKAFCNRTNRHFGTFTEQIVRRSQGAREVLAANAAAEGGGATAPAPRPPNYQPQTPSTDAEAAPTAELAVGDGASAAATGAAPALVAAGGAATKASTTNGVGSRAESGKTRLSVAALSARPGLSSTSALLRLPKSAFVPVLSRADITARFECGARRSQVVRAAPSVNGRPWYDEVCYEIEAGDEELCVGEVRAMVRLAGGDHALVREWEPAEEEPGCPLVDRSCVRLQWSFNAGAGEVCVRLVPLECIKRLAMVVPDFGDLKARRGVGAMPPALHAQPHEYRDSRFFLNAFFPW